MVAGSSDVPKKTWVHYFFPTELPAITPFSILLCLMPDEFTCQRRRFSYPISKPVFFNPYPTVIPATTFFGILLSLSNARGFYLSGEEALVVNNSL